jgi:poly-gamma-glutamate synthesis protein (capsule biosynthesis protein)
LTISRKGTETGHKDITIAVTEDSFINRRIPDEGLSVPADFVPEFAQKCIDAGADMFIGGASHSLLRGVEAYKNKPILYDPEDFMHMADTVARLPADFYLSPGLRGEVRNGRATPTDGFEARKALPPPLNPPGGYHSAKVIGSVVGVCSFENGGKLTEVTLHPVVMTDKPTSQSGRPMLADDEMSKKIIDYLAELSAPFGTIIEFQDGVGRVRL